MPRQRIGIAVLPAKALLPRNNDGRNSPRRLHVVLNLQKNCFESYEQVAPDRADRGDGGAIWHWRLTGRQVCVDGRLLLEYEGIPPMLKVSVRGTGAYLGFRGALMDDGTPVVEFENGARPQAKKLVNTFCKMHRGVIDGNKFNARVNDFVRNFADGTGRVRLSDFPPPPGGSRS
jgi:hypothetical protein